MKNKKSILAWVLALVAVCAFFLALYLSNKPKAEAGTKAYTLEVVDNEGQSKVYTGKTDAEFLRGVMDELAAKGDFSYEGTEGAYGLMIETVNGVTADYAKDGAYWAIYVNDEYGMYGADAQPVTDGDAFKLVYEGASAQ